MDFIDTTKHEKSLAKISADWASVTQTQKKYKIQSFLSLGATAILGTISAASLFTNTVQPSDVMVAVEATAYFSLIAAAYNKFKEVDNNYNRIAIEDLVEVLDSKDRHTVENLKDKIITDDNANNSLSSQIIKLRDKLLAHTQNAITDKPSLK